MQQMQVTMVYLRTKADTDYQHLATTCFDPTLFLSLKRQSAPNPTYVSLLFYNLELFSCYLYLDYKNKLFVFSINLSGMRLAVLKKNLKLMKNTEFLCN